MAVRANVMFKFDKITDLIWLGIFDALLEMSGQEQRKDVSTDVIGALGVKAYSLMDQQFIQLTLSMPNSKQIIVHFPRTFVIAITEGVPTERIRKMGF